MKVLSVPEACQDLLIIQADDGNRFQAAMDQCGIKSHHYYFPRLLFGGQRGNRVLLFEEIEGSIVLYSLWQGVSRLRLSLYVPPFPFSAAALGKAQQRMHDFNRGRASRIDFVQESDAPVIERHGFSTSLREREFIYDGAAVAGLEGSGFARVRRYLASVDKYEGLMVREFTPADEAACMMLYLRFGTQLQAKGVRPKGYSTMVNCLKGATGLPASRLRGEIFEIDGTIRAFSFGGPINSTHGCVFLTISDHEFPGLAYALRHQMVRNFPELAYFNDSTDNQRPGLAEMKQGFRPTEMHGILGAREMR